ncbi:MAG: PAS domain-containing protein [Deltaproteobacteria bacterium]|nr:MAG: PAS domain-containing protein [Deltaproteobacteria bacterium]
MLLCPSCPQACITPGFAEANGRPVASCTGRASVSARSATRGRAGSRPLSPGRSTTTAVPARRRGWSPRSTRWASIRSAVRCSCQDSSGCRCRSRRNATNRSNSAGSTSPGDDCDRLSLPSTRPPTVAPCPGSAVPLSSPAPGVGGPARRCRAAFRRPVTDAPHAPRPAGGYPRLGTPGPGPRAPAPRGPASGPESPLSPHPAIAVDPAIHLPDDVTAASVAADLADVAWFVVDSEHRVLQWSPAAEALTGFTAAETIGNPCIASVRCHRCLSGCGVFERGWSDGEITLYLKDGTRRAVRKKGQALRDDAGHLVGAIEVLLPVAPPGPTADRGQRPVDHMTQALGRVWLRTGADLVIQDVSAGVTALTGWRPEELVGRHLSTLFGEETWEAGGTLQTALERGERREGLFATLRRADGDGEAVSLSAARDEERRVHIMLRSQADHLSDHDSRMVFEGMVARSASMQRIFRLIEVLGDSDSTALIIGESGTGKELIARALHNRSSRSGGPFVAVNCGALPAELLESELFGHVRGAFTSAFRDRQGRFELAEGGTLFLDEIGDLPKPLQVKLLRVLEDRTFQRVGDSRTRTADVRVIAATNVDLRQAVADKRFREDLYYRLRVLPIEVPPLRERKEDLPPLIRHLLGRIGRQRGRAVKLSPSAMRRLLAHDWPGNVRELENVLEYATAVCEGQTVHEDDLPRELHDSTHRPDPQAAARSGEAAAGAASPARAGSDDDADEPPERRQLRLALERAHYRRREAAALLGISRTTLWRRMKEYGLE